ncbi:hypothetical protein [Streptomyces sp. NPDC059757]|uniref:hypothetical protein n=1 Tax=Streptomyces sp. NPDC059757 TaxID=3346935 RepID=UPI0036464BAD
MTWLLTLLLLGAVIYSLHEPPPAEPGKGPQFNALVYAADLLLPVIDIEGPELVVLRRA